jgi:hypothetical protein
MTFHDQYENKRMTESEVFTAKMADEEIFVPKFEGQITDKVIFLEDGVHKVTDDIVVGAKAGEELVLPVGYNTVVDNASILIAALIKRHAGFAGALFWEVGSGDASWSDTSPPSPAKTDTKLLTPSFRKAIQLADISFINASNAVVSTPTNRIQIVVKFLANEANGYLREFGIFGGGSDAVVGTLGSGLMINRKTHGVIYKTSAMELERTLRFTF